MRIPRGTWLSSAAIVFLAGLLSNSSDLIILSAAAAAAGLGTELVAALRRFKQEPARGEAAGARELEERLLLTEAALTSATRALEMLKEQREFEMQVRSFDETLPEIVRASATSPKVSNET